MKVAVLMGSKSDWPVMKNATKWLKDWKIPFEVRVISRHRTPYVLDEFLEYCDADVFICGAGGAAHLAGATASKTCKPVIGVPISSSLGGWDALFATIQMPGGVPVATVAVDGALNAAILATQILAVHNNELAVRLRDFVKDRAEKVKADDIEIQKLAEEL